MAEVLLDVRRLVTTFATEIGRVRVVDDVSFSLRKGETLGIVGESGCGKSVTALSIMQLLPRPFGAIESGEILYAGKDLAKSDPKELSRIRGRRIAMIFQEPMTALNPVHPVGRQIGEIFRLHYPNMNDPEVHEASLRLLRKVGIPDPEIRMHHYPHQISGGMRQRVMIAIALACNPDILIADEPTTALDVTIQAQVIDLIRSLQRETGMSLIFITHDLGVIAEICDTVLVMYAGRIAESAPARHLFHNPLHPYTHGLLSSIPHWSGKRKSRMTTIDGVVPGIHELPEGCRFQNRCPHAQSICIHSPAMQVLPDDHCVSCHFAGKLPLAPIRETETAPLPLNASQNDLIDENALNVIGLTMHFPVRSGIFLRRTGIVHALDGVSLRISSGKTLGLVGESGCGKTTLGRCVLRLYEPTGGIVHWRGEDVLRLNRQGIKRLRRDIQMIFQDPFESLNARHTVGAILEEPFHIHGIGSSKERKASVEALLEKVGLPQSSIDRFPHEFSGGQRQRIGIARAVALNPRLIVCDEPVSALDVSIRSQILNLLLDLQQELGLTYLFISHDLTVVKHISDHVAVMYLGVIIEYTDADSIYGRPVHPYTQALISAIPSTDPAFKRISRVLEGDVPSPVQLPSGCRFHTRCPIRIKRCIEEVPVLQPAPCDNSRHHLVACHRACDIVNHTI